MPASRPKGVDDTHAQTANHDSARGVRALSGPLTLRAYDAVFLGLSNPLVWRCPTARVLDHYRQHLSDQHLEAGVGTGYLLDHSRFPGKKPRVTLLDDNPHALDFARLRLGRYAPRVRLENLRTPIAFDETYRSVALSHVLQSLPGTMQGKADVFAHFKSGLLPGGVLFGATILGPSATRSLAARALLALYNRQGIFSNQDDDAEGLASALQRHFERYQIEVVGSVALFTAYR